MAEERAAEAGLSDKVNVHLCDYRKLPRSFEDSFDALVTCEMIEVGVFCFSAVLLGFSLSMEFRRLLVRDTLPSSSARWTGP